MGSDRRSGLESAIILPLKVKLKKGVPHWNAFLYLVLAAGFEPATSSFGGKHSIQLSYASVSFVLRLFRNYRDVLDPDRLLWPFAVFGHAGDRHDVVHPFDHLSKNRIFIIECGLSL